LRIDRNDADAAAGGARAALDRTSRRPVLDATDQLTARLREYLDSVRFDLADIDEDIADPF
jgi:hypothetical protein